MALEEACVLWPPTETYKNMPTTKRQCKPINTQAQTYDYLMSLIVFVTALIVNFWLYACIILALRQRPASSASGVDDRQKTIAHRVRNQVARTLILNGVLFFLCQTPYRLYYVIDFLVVVHGFDNLESIHTLIDIIGHGFLFLNSVINPFVYVFSCQFYRRSMMKAFGFGHSPTYSTRSSQAKYLPRR